MIELHIINSTVMRHYDAEDDLCFGNWFNKEDGDGIDRLQRITFPDTARSLLIGRNDYSIFKVDDDYISYVFAHYQNKLYLMTARCTAQHKELPDALKFDLLISALRRMIDIIKSEKQELPEFYQDEDNWHYPPKD